jgi:hypothetical protein
MAAAKPTGIRARVDAMAEIEALVAFEGRAPGSDAERRAAGRMAGRLCDLGRPAEIEPFSTWPGWLGAYSLLAAAGIAACVVSVSQPVVGACIATTAFVLLMIDAGGVAAVARRAFGRRSSQNVVSLMPATRPGALVLVAHLDAGRTGVVHRPGVRRLMARLGRPQRLLGGPLQGLAWTMAAVCVSCLVRVVGVEGDPLTAVQFALAVLLLVALPLLVDAWLSPTVPGAGDNASGVALALRLADRLGDDLEHFDVHVVLTGAQESLADGMRAFVRRHFSDLPRGRTVILNLDEVGAGSVRYTVREGPLLAPRSHPQVVEACEEIAADSPAPAPGPLVNRSASDGFAARSAGYPSLTVTCRDELGLAPLHHRRMDLPEMIDPASLADAEEFCAELIRRLDAGVGPELSG